MKGAGPNGRSSSHGLRAFTLAEMLAILAVLAVLGFLLLPALASSKANTKAFQCLNNNQRLGEAWRMYAGDNSDRIVYASDDGTGAANPANQYAWTQSHLDFNPNNRPNWDINADIVLRPLWAYTGKNAGTYKCPSDKSYVVVNGTPRPRVRSLSMNLYLGGFAGTSGGFASVTSQRIFLKTSELSAPGPANTFVFLDMRQDTIGWGNFFTDMTGFPGHPAQYQIQDFPGMLHENSATFSFADGRGELHRWRDLRTTARPPQAGPSPSNQDVGWLQAHATRPK